ncbi:hypothetical protein BC826DRAFT_968066 [Russula brevipes]|nr:hypothetical protein BC826DRAFT_968066 [Russula brevipes]
MSWDILRIWPPPHPLFGTQAGLPSTLTRDGTNLERCKCTGWRKSHFHINEFFPPLCQAHRSDHISFHIPKELWSEPASRYEEHVFWGPYEAGASSSNRCGANIRLSIGLGGALRPRVVRSYSGSTVSSKHPQPLTGTDTSHDGGPLSSGRSHQQDVLVIGVQFLPPTATFTPVDALTRRVTSHVGLYSTTVTGPASEARVLESRRRRTIPHPQECAHLLMRDTVKKDTGTV